MKRLFADTVYWIALTNSFDQYHAKAVEVSSALGHCRLFTTEAVLTEFLNALADKGPHVRAAAVEMVEAIMNNSRVTVIPQSRHTFNRSLAFYKARPDKGYSLTDCGSMLLMRERHLSEALTTDRHFEQEGFTALLRIR
ncbi:MAG: PIN domain-containing protein [Nitrospira sp.]|nr:PIN domain-containing protein [Nitrospira sp.]MBH0180210.1 PIN domain-containing protein [Nitrospira sp.]MBH0184237.1 PIN domain-containing protein [Nitrospira sp.]